MTTTAERALLEGTAGAGARSAGEARALRRARHSTRAFFFLMGVALATWAAMVPFAKTKLGLSEGRLGAILLAFGFGTIAATLGARTLLGRYGSRVALRIAGPAVCVMLPLLALAPSAVTLAVLLFVFGALVGLAGVASNAQAIAVQELTGRPIMSGFHAQFSIGGLIGAALGSFLLHRGVPVVVCAGVAALGLLVLDVAFARGLVADVQPEAAGDARRGVPPAAVLLVGAMTLCMYLAEGAVLDWGAVFLHEARDYSVSAAALGYAAFSVAMATGRLLGDAVVARLGAVLVVRFGALLAAAGFAVLVWAPWGPAGLVGCALIGLGASNVVPTLITASALVSDLPTGAAVATVVAMGTCGLIAGPAIIGFAAQATSLGVALSVLAGLLLLVGLVAPAVRRRPAVG